MVWVYEGRNAEGNGSPILLYSMLDSSRSLSLGRCELQPFPGKFLTKRGEATDERRGGKLHPKNGCHRERRALKLKLFSTHIEKVLIGK